MPRTWKLVVPALLVFVASSTSARFAAAQEPTAAESGAPETVRIGNLDWHTDFATAVRQATEQERMLVVFFHNGPDDRARRAFESRVLADPHVERQLEDYVRATVPVDCRVQFVGRDEPVTLLEQPCFRYCANRQGLAVMDFAPDSPYCRRVVSAHPFTPGRLYSASAVRTILGLPRGSITQRTLVFAVRINPEDPRSADGQFSTYLASQADRHSNYQASVGQCGHQNFHVRFHEMNAALGNGYTVQEVAAESWPNMTLVDAAIDLVSAWRSSSGHWSAVSAYQPLFAYDMEPGPAGRWYGTGLFARSPYVASGAAVSSRPVTTTR